MSRIGPAIFSLFGVIYFAGIWIIYLFVAQPEGGIISGATEQLSYSFDSSEHHSSYFLATVVSLVLCCTYTIMFWFRKSPKVAMALVGVNTALALTLYSWSAALIVAGPLIYVRQVIQNA